ncbi:MAG: chemotaxis protein CheW [Gemmatimonadaceae bacterium]
MASIEESADPAAPRYLITRVGGQRVAWVMSSVREIIPSRPATRLPGAPEWVLGLLNLRGTVVTVVDLANRLGLLPGAGQSVLMVESGPKVVGVRVDAVDAVAAAEDARVEPVEGARSADGMVAGMVRLENGTALLMDADVIIRPFRMDG